MVFCVVRTFTQVLFKEASPLFDAAADLSWLQSTVLLC
ncbi:hypothetical protein F441_07124 [Phytophthora nicotianae CJ01A1]|uniref:Uncharacterized protein n=1 Tax=Phytophthora nicotianae CJ01A1 TaxID=1317063 RepID=W2X843_PHYNI|nr:hypothetical protein F441_07124 [Phytophthora nicotianae CJ01A1]